jgi:hypothetical protein
MSKAKDLFRSAVEHMCNADRHYIHGISRSEWLAVREHIMVDGVPGSEYEPVCIGETVTGLATKSELDVLRPASLGITRTEWHAVRDHIKVNGVPGSKHDVHTVGEIVMGLSCSTFLLAPPPPAPAPAAAVVLPFRSISTPAADADVVRRSMWPGTYQEYIATREYQRLAALAKRDWNYECILNRAHRGPVEMHHRTYLRVPFGESWWDLIPLCEECHARYHHKLPAPPVGLFDDPAIRRAA